MDDIDQIVNQVLKGMGVDPSQPSHWIPHKHRAVDQASGVLVREYDDGYICSNCGKHSYSKKSECSGCKSVMIER